MKTLTLAGKLANSWYRLRSSETVIGITLAILVGAVAGLGAVAFRWMIRGFQWVFFKGGATVFGFMGDYHVIILPALGGLFVGPFIYLLAREAKGHGVPEVMAAVAAKGGRIRPRVSIVKSVASSLCIGSGGSVGREGPIVQIGSSFGSAIGQWLKLPEDWIKTLVACGAAGGISATFNAPIGGIFFAQEVILHRFITPSFIFVALSSVIANIVSQAFLGSSPSFTVPGYAMVSAWEIIFYILLGIIAAFIAWLFICCLYKCEDFFDTLKLPEYIKPALGGLFIGLIGLFYPDLLGVGYGAGYSVGGVFVEHGGVDKALLGELSLGLLLTLGLLKIAATSLTIGSGGSGGIFSPSLFIGSMLGGAFGEIIHRLFPTSTASVGAYAMVGMGAVFAGAARAPFTSFIMLFEMTRDYKIILPLITAVVISTLIARKLSPESIYTAKVRRLGVELRILEERDIMKTIRVGEVMTRDFPTVPLKMSAQELLDRLERTGHHGFPVVDDEGRFCGIVTLSDVHTAMEKGDAELNDLTVNDIANKSPLVAYPDQSLHEVLLRLGAKDYGRIPVVDRNDRSRLLGVLRRHDIIKAYISRAAKSAPHSGI